MYKTLGVICIFILSIFISEQVFAQHTIDKFKITGDIKDKSTGEPVSYAVVILKPWEIYTIADESGQFSFQSVTVGACDVLISCLGYVDYEKHLYVDKNTKLSIEMNLQSFKIDEVNVMSKRKQGGDKIEIDQTAIEHIQPTSLHDIFLLLPGSVYSNAPISQFKPISTRQVGSDANSSLGVGVMTDGVPLSTDGMRSQMIGIRSNSADQSDGVTQARTSTNQGADLRYISTDHIESIEFIKGIASAKYGNLSSGLIQINSKKGESPFRVRLKGDLKNKLIYVGKGFKLSENKGTINVGVDYLNSIDDVREEMDKFSRLTAQAFYNRLWKQKGGQFELDLKLNQTITTNKMKRDELTYEYNEHYEANYARTGFMAKGVLTKDRGVFNKLDFLTSLDIVDDNIARHMMVMSNSGALSAPMATTAGEHEGAYLPAQYYSDFYIENIPINFFVQINNITRTQFTSNFFANFESGFDYRVSKNVGMGAVIEDPLRPPFPHDNTYMRPRSNKSIPAIMSGAVYLQSNWGYLMGENILRLSAGARLTQLFNLPKDYDLRGKNIIDPRINLSYKLKVNDNITNEFRVGYGVENKLPTLDYLYPEKVYKDFYMLNSYSNNPAYRRLITHTHIFDVTNPAINANRNDKYEVGYDISFGDLNLSLIGFYEISETGYEYFNSYMPLNYDYYYQVKPGVDISDRKPTKDDYLVKDYNVFTSSSKVENSKTVKKQGVEYRITFPKIKSLYTQVEVNGAYYKTDYGTTMPMQYYPNKIIADNPYKYVGIYDNYPSTTRKRFNTNIWFNTHIPKFGLILTNFFQFVWMETEQYFDQKITTPSYLLDHKGYINAVTAEQLQLIESRETELRHLKRSISPLDYVLNSEPITLMWNIKATKELGKFAKASFFVNNIVDINPIYKTGENRTERKWMNPYFGLEVYLNF